MNKSHSEINNSRPEKSIRLDKFSMGVVVINGIVFVFQGVTGVEICNSSVLAGSSFFMLGAIALRQLGRSK